MKCFKTMVVAMTINQSIKLIYSATKSWPESWPT